MYKELNKVDTEKNKVKVDLITNNMINLKKVLKMPLKMIWIKLKR